jgi:stage II sporulation protein M
MKKRNKKNNFNLIAEYKKSWEYLRQSRNFILIAIGIFVSFILFGFFIPAPEFIYNKIITFIQEVLNTTQNMSASQLIIFIISNNIQTTFFGLFLGMFFGVLPLINAVFNGYVLGFVSALSVKSEGIFVLWRLLPHGIFELPAVFISLGLGLKLGTFMFQKDKSKSFKDYLINSLRVFLLIIIPLLIIAGIIEGFLIKLLG